MAATTVRCSQTKDEKIETLEWTRNGVEKVEKQKQKYFVEMNKDKRIKACIKLPVTQVSKIHNFKLSTSPPSKINFSIKERIR